MKPLVAIVGLPNVGKSTLLNKIAGQSLAITSDVAGTTRDRQYMDTSWNGKEFTLIDTAGLSDAGKDMNPSLRGLELDLHKQIEVALKEADIILLVVDGKQPVSMTDRPALQKFRKTKKPLLLAVNKLDAARQFGEKTEEFNKLGIKSIFPVSSINGRGIGDLLDGIVETINAVGTRHDASALSVTPPVRHNFSDDGSLVEDGWRNPAPTIHVSLIGKPNVGKSSLFNTILKEERVVVSPIPGTTRTAIDVPMEIAGQKYIFIDTAGLKKKEYRQAQPDVYAGFQTFKAIRRSDVCLFMIDAIEEITKQDQRVASEIFDMQKGCIVIANKMDLYDGEEEKLKDYISLHFPFLWMCPVFFVSSKTGQGLDEALLAIKPIYERRHKQIADETLKDFLAKKMKINPPKLLRDQKNPKVFALRQLEANPPLFELVVNHPAAISQQFRKYLENSIIKELDFYGTPISLKLKGKDKT